jgi:single stranded DNA-binding protein
VKNRIELQGYLAARPERRLLPTGTSVANAKLGETYLIVRGNGKAPDKHTNWHSLSFYGERASTAARLEKGAHLFIVGHIECREWTGKDGSKRSTWEVQVSHFHQIAKDAKPEADAAVEVPDAAAWPA